MIIGAVGANRALLVISVAENEFENGHRKGQSGATMRDHSLLASPVGSMGTIVAINKVDICDWSESRYKHNLDETKILEQL